MNSVVGGVQQYQCSLLDHLKSQMENVFKKHSGNSASQLEKYVLEKFEKFLIHLLKWQQPIDRTVLLRNSLSLWKRTKFLLPKSYAENKAETTL